MKRHITIVNVILVVDFLIHLTIYSSTVLKAKFSKARWLFIVDLRVLVYIILFIFNIDFNIIY